MQFSFKKIILSVAVLLPLFVIKVDGQTAKAETLTNKNVIDIAKAGLGNDIIIAKINSSTCKFDVSTTALIDLKKQGVSQEVISTMMTKAAGKAGADQPVAPTPHTNRTALPIITQLNFVHYSDKGAALPLEKSLGNSKSKKLAFGYKGTILLLEIIGATSPVKITEAMAESFMINMGGNNLPDLVLFKLKTEKDKRYAIVGKLTLSGPKSGENMLPIEFTKLSEGVYNIKPGTKLVKGEYFFTAKPNLNSSTSSSDVYAFTLL